MESSQIAAVLALAKRERRGSQRSFVVAGLAMALAVAILATVIGVTDSLRASFTGDAKSLLGGDLEVKLVTRGFDDGELQWLAENSAEHSLVKTTRAIALAGDSPQLVYLKGVDASYPLLGELELEAGPAYSPALLARAEGAQAHPAVISADLRGLLGLEVGDTFQIGNAALSVAAIIAREPDPNTRVWVVAPPVIVSQEAFTATNLELPGSIVRRRVRLMFPDGVSEDEFRTQLKERFPQANWELEDHQSVLSNFSRVLNRLETFLTIASLATILIAGIGIGNTVSAFLAARLSTIATLKSLGGTSELVRQLYLLQIGVICTAGAAVGAAIGAAATALLVPVISGYLPLEVRAEIGPGMLVSSVLYAMMSALVFALPPLHRYSLTSPTLLFSPANVAAAYEPAALPMSGRVAPGIVAALLLALLYATSTDERVFYWTVSGGLVAMLLFVLLGHLLSRLAARVNGGSLAVRLAFRSIARSPIQLRVGMVSFGAALTALTALLLTQSNLDEQLDGGLQGKSPSFYMIGVQQHQRESLLSSSLAREGIDRVIMLPFIRGRITKMAGVPVEEIETPDEYGWVLDNDRGLTWIEAPEQRPRVSTARDLVTPEWLGSAGGQLEVSFDEGAAEAYGLGLGDTISFAVADEEFRATITELRPIDWRDLRINFVMIFSRSDWQDVPSGYLGGIHMDRGQESAYMRQMAEEHPNVTLISTGAIFATARRLISNVNAIINVVTLVAVLTGLLVIVTTVVQGQQMRTMQLMVMRVLGADRVRLTAVFCIEFAVMTALATLPALLIGSLGAFMAITELFDLQWSMDVGAAATIAAAMALLSALGGIASMQSSLRQSPLRYLRNE